MSHRTDTFSLYFFLLPNLADTLGLTVWFIGHIWTIGVEEQFYLLLPVVLKKLRKHVVSVLLLVVVFAIFTDLSVYYKNHIPGAEDMNGWYTFVKYAKTFRMETIAIGCLGAYLFVTNEKLKNLIFHPLIERLNIFALFWMTINQTYALILDTYIYAVFATIFIVNLAANPNTILRLENKWFSYFGRISYGIYMYHCMVICFVVIWIAEMKLQETNFVASHVLVYTLSLAGTLILSTVSYKLLEKPFLNLKKKHTIVPSLRG